MCGALPCQLFLYNTNVARYDDALTCCSGQTLCCYAADAQPRTLKDRPPHSVHAVFMLHSRTLAQQRPYWTHHHQHSQQFEALQQQKYPTAAEDPTLVGNMPDHNRQTTTQPCIKQSMSDIPAADASSMQGAPLCFSLGSRHTSALHIVV
jgi:hypothetical protein